MLEETFKKIFHQFNPTDEQIQSFVSDFTTGLAITLIMNADLSSDEEHQVDELIKNGNMQGALNLLEAKFPTREEWEEYVKSQTTSLFTNYIQTVVPA